VPVKKIVALLIVTALSLAACSHATTPAPVAGPGSEPASGEVISPGPSPSSPSPSPSRTPRAAKKVAGPRDRPVAAGTYEIAYDVTGASSLTTVLAGARARLRKSTGLAIYLRNGTTLNADDLAAVQKLGITTMSRLYIYNLTSLPGGKECTPASGLACAGQTARGGRFPYLWFNGWWDSWVKDLVLDDLTAIKQGAFSNTAFRTVSFKSATSVGPMAFGHGPHSPLAHLYLPSVRTIGHDAFRRNQYLETVDLPNAVKIDDFAFDDNDRLVRITAPRLRSIGRNSLNDTHSLKTVEFPKLTYMGINCFDLNSAMTSLSLPSLTYLDKNALAGLSRLKTFTAPRLKFAAEGSMANHPALTKIVAPRLATLQNYALGGNPALTELHLGSTVPTQAGTPFAGDDATKLRIYYTGKPSTWSAFVPAGLSKVPLVKE